MMKRMLSILTGLFACIWLSAQPARLILSQEEGRITFAVDEVELPDTHCGWKATGDQLALDLRRNYDGDPFSDWKPEILANSFADADNLYDIGEDVIFQMLLKAWCQHRPVVLTPDAIWLVICQQFSHIVNENPDRYRSVLVNHQGKKELQVWSNDLFSEQADWEGLISGFTAEIDKYTNNGLATTLVADFSTTGRDERIASEVTLMDVVKPYFEYTAIYAVCGIPSITLTGTPDDWRKVLAKTRALEAFGMGWWTSDLMPILEEFVKAAEGRPDYWFWKDIVCKTRPKTVQGPVCSKRQPRLTQFDGWFLKFFPYDNKGRTPRKVDITQTMLPETVVVPFKYQVVASDGSVLEETPLELVAGIVGVLQDPDYTLTPKIGWFVRTVKIETRADVPDAADQFFKTSGSPNIFFPTIREWKSGNTRFHAGLAQIEEAQSNDMRFYPRGFGMGMHWGIGSEFYTGPIADYVTPVAGVDFGFDFCYNRINLYLGGLLGWGGRFKLPIPRDGYQWNAGERMKGGNIEVSLGYTVLDSQWWKVAPFAGIGVGFIDYPSHPADPDKNTDEISGFRYQAGISTDLKFHRVVDYVQALEGLSELSVRSRLYVAHTAFPSPAPSWSVNLGLSVNMLGWILKK